MIYIFHSFKFGTDIGSSYCVLDARHFPFCPCVTNSNVGYEKKKFTLTIKTCLDYV